MTAPARFFCAEAARERGDPLAGTAPYGAVWILIEYRGGWPSNGYDGLDLEPATKSRVYAAAQAVRARILLIRRPGRRRSEGPKRWAVLHGDRDGAHRQQWGTWNDDWDLAAIAQALDPPDAPNATGEAGPGRPPVLLVCTHGPHDTCCAVRGRPVAQALGERWPELVWECTHIGGDRFAASVVVAPDGVYYGNLDAGTSLTAVEHHLADRIHANHLRGYTDLTPAQQVAVAAVLRESGPAGRHDYAVERTVRDNDRWLIRVAGIAPGLPSYDVEVTSHRTPARQLTCHGRFRSSALVHEVTALRAV
ncbi:sucrase ferredoxin [Streptomyces sp. NPDC051561]|uniref:sucrase ferredoxin n=1 Tax=Streptomyces sp. NPDC051561 TaxID=3365658 RepID=UPI00378FA0DE